MTEFVAEVNAIKLNSALIATADLVVVIVIEDILSGGTGIVNDAPAFSALGYNVSLVLQKLYELFPQMQSFDFSDPMRNVPIRTSYHIKKQTRMKFLNCFSKLVLFWHLNLLKLL